jgi:hypothetical protein
VLPTGGDYYKFKWGAVNSNDNFHYPLPFKGIPHRNFLNHIKGLYPFVSLLSTPCNVADSFTNRADPDTFCGQLEFIKYVLRLSRAQNILTTGIHNGEFLFILYALDYSGNIFCADVDKDSETVKYLNELMYRINIEVVPDVSNKLYDLAWVDLDTSAENLEVILEEIDAPYMGITRTKVHPEYLEVINKSGQFKVETFDFCFMDKLGTVLLTRE